MKHLLAINLGNTHINIGYWKDAELVLNWQFDTNHAGNHDYYTKQFTAIVKSEVCAGVKPDAAGCSVVPILNAQISSAFRLLFNTDLHWIKTCDLKIPVNYHPIESLGVDRVLNVLAARESWGSPVIVVDYGTAITVDVMDATGVYRGGAILAGVNTAAEALWQKTAQLHATDLDIMPPSAIGSTTVECLRVGLMMGGTLAVDGLIERIREELAADAPVIITGGMGQKMSLGMKHVTAVVPELTLQGIRLAALLRNNKKLL
jgi:type III pantothenate kinase